MAWPWDSKFPALQEACCRGLQPCRLLIRVVTNTRRAGTTPKCRDMARSSPAVRPFPAAVERPRTARTPTGGIERPHANRNRRLLIVGHRSTTCRCSWPVAPLQSREDLPAPLGATQLLGMLVVHGGGAWRWAVKGKGRKRGQRRAIDRSRSNGAPLGLRSSPSALPALRARSCPYRGSGVGVAAKKARME